MKTPLNLQSVRKVIRVRKEDSALVYHLLESYEGIASYSTLDHEVGSPFRELELRVPPDFVEEVERLLESFKELFGEGYDEIR